MDEERIINIINQRVEIENGKKTISFEKLDDIFSKKLFVMTYASNLMKNKFFIIACNRKDFVPKKLQFGDVFVTECALIGK